MMLTVGLFFFSEPALLQDFRSFRCRQLFLMDPESEAFWILPRPTSRYIGAENISWTVSTRGHYAYDRSMFHVHQGYFSLVEVYQREKAFFSILSKGTLSNGVMSTHITGVGNEVNRRKPMRPRINNTDEKKYKANTTFFFCSQFLAANRGSIYG